MLMCYHIVKSLNKTCVSVSDYPHCATQCKRRNHSAASFLFQKGNSITSDTEANHDGGDDDLIKNPKVMMMNLMMYMIMMMMVMMKNLMMNLMMMITNLMMGTWESGAAVEEDFDDFVVVSVGRQDLASS